jgi:hypothetical protein
MLVAPVWERVCYISVSHKLNTQPTSARVTSSSLSAHVHKEAEIRTIFVAVLDTFFDSYWAGTEEATIEETILISFTLSGCDVKAFTRVEEARTGLP